MTIDIFKQYFAAECVYNGVERKGVSVTLTSTSGGGEIKYEVTISFFQHRDAEDFAISYDAYGSKEIFKGKGRRSKKREAQFMEELRVHAEELATGMNGIIFWEKPLIEARLG